VAHFRRRGAEAAAEGAVEVGEIAEPDGKGDGAHGPLGKTEVAEHPPRAHEPLAEHQRRERDPFTLEQHMDVTWRHVLAARHGGHRQLRAVHMLEDVGLDRFQPRRAHATALGDCRAVARGAARHRH
jgi:hypothetical protein